MRRPTTRTFMTGALVAATLAVLLVVAAPALAVSLPGDQLWQKTCAVSGSSGFVEMARGPGGVVYAVGSRDYKSGGKDCECILVAKYATSGRLLWKRSLAGGAIPNGSEGDAIAADGAGNVTVIGLKNTKTQGGDIIVARYSPAGALLWTHTFNGAADDTDQAFDVALDRSGNAYVAGMTSTAAHGYDLLLLKYAGSSGRRLWKYTHNYAIANLDDGANAVALDRSGAAYVTGWSINTGSVNGAAPVIKVSAAGKGLWTQRLNIGVFADGLRIARDGNGDVVVGGDFLGAVDRELFAAKLMPGSGAQVWPARLLAYAYDQTLTDMAIGRCHNDIYLVGQSTGGPVDLGVIADYKYDGTPLWDTFYQPLDLANGSMNWTAVALDAHDDLFVAGRETSATTSFFHVGKAEWDGTWPLWQNRLDSGSLGHTTPMDALWTGGSSGGVYVCGVMTKSGVDYAYIAKYKP